MNGFLDVNASFPVSEVRPASDVAVTCLIAEDDPDDRDIFLMAVESVDKECQCVFVPDGLSAIARLEEGTITPDCIFLDLNMPRLSGLQCLKLLKDHPSYEGIPVVIYSTSSDTTFRNEALQLGAVAYVAKPSRISDFTVELNSIFLNLAAGR